MVDHKSPFSCFQLSYGSLQQRLRDKMEFPFLFQMAPNEASQNEGIVRMLRYFQWTWIGLIVSDDDNGEEFEQSLKSTFRCEEICVAFTEKMPYYSFKVLISSAIRLYAKKDFMAVLMTTKANVIIVYGDAKYMSGFHMVLLFHEMMTPLRKVWITTTRWEVTSFLDKAHTQVFHGSLSIATHKNVVPGFRSFLQSFKLSQHGNSEFMKNFWSAVFHCKIGNSYKGLQYVPPCTGKES